MIGRNKKLVGSAIAGIFVASAILATITMAPYTSVIAPREPKLFLVNVAFTEFTAVNLTIIEKYGGEVIDARSLDFSAYVKAKIPRENITKLADEDAIKFIGYYSYGILYGEKEPEWNIVVENMSRQLKLAMYLEKTVFQLGEDVNVKFMLINEGEKDVTLLKGWLTFDFIVYNSTGLIHKWSHRKFGIPEAGRISLKSGENISDMPYEWEQIYDVDQEIVDGKIIPKYDFLPVSPGTYHIVGQEALSYPTTNTTIQTPPLEITILQT